MDIHDLFEAHYAEQHDESPEWIKGFRMRNGSYALAKISTAFRYFKAGFEANKGEKMQALGYLCKENVESIQEGMSEYLQLERFYSDDVVVYVKQCDSHKTGGDV